MEKLLSVLGNPGEGDVRGQVLTAVTQVVGGDIVAYQTIDQANGRSEQVSVPDSWVTREYEEIFVQHVPKHPLFRHYLRTGELDATRLSDVATVRQLRGLGIYQDFYRPLGIGYQMICRLRGELGVSDILVFNRGGTDFTDTEQQFVRMTRPFLANLVDTAAATSWFDTALAALEGIDDTAYGVVLLGPLGKIRVTNRSARLLLTAYFRRPGKEGDVLPEELAAWLAAQGHTPQPYTAARGARRLTVRLFRHHASAALLLSESTATVPAVRTGVLTAREQDVLWLVTHGRTSAQAAHVLGISTRTVEKHLENIYNKLGVTNRAEAATEIFGK
ncbi:LuxR C-terminal-related transcriptional regulator [Kibdelosporangium philippinense]|uniref:LuxR C-terminal-related transcriptional regulator n=1 Tax=Kibdelosporangium philippinense TaxID=211113 RepID=A0ABS8ZMX0_9PSEU|nr:helix-turn-helix transcriptional regulator [Kibdelosporangium philippinense]MCE7007961.1 LuxR C-terminal-related transcriptional regulator [Kibdelosporangium philippinense]